MKFISLNDKCLNHLDSIKCLRDIKTFVSTFRLSMAGPMASAFVPDSVHPVVPKLLPGMVASQMGRSTVASIQNRPMFDPLFNLASNELPGLPMSEEEFYRMKIKLKDG